MRIKLILAATPYDALRNKEPFMPLSLPLLAACAPEHDYELLDMLRHKGPIDYDAPCDLVGISVRLTNEALAYSMADAFRARGVTVVLGGAQVTATPHRALGHADAVVVGEAETLWPRLLDDRERGELRQFYVCSPKPFDPRGSSCFQTEGLPSLDTIPQARRDLMAGRYQFQTLFAARGCPIDCDFCAVPGIFGKKLRFRPVDDVVAEIQTLSGFYYLLDDTVFGRRGHHDYYLELYKKVAALPHRKLWTGQGNLDAAGSKEGREVIRQAARAGLLYVAIGLESLDPDSQKKAGTAAKSAVLSAADATQEMKDRIRFIQDQGMLVSGWFTFGYEHDSLETFHRMREFCEQTQILPIISPINAIAATKLYSSLEKQGLLDADNPFTNVPHPTLRPHQVLEALRHNVSHGFSLRQTLKRTLFYAPRFLRTASKPEDFFAKTVFSFVMQREMSQILDRENDNLESPIPQNFIP